MKEYWDDLSQQQQADLALALDSSVDYLRQVFNGYRQVGAKRAKQIERETGGMVKACQLRPDVFDAA